MPTKTALAADTELRNTAYAEEIATAKLAWGPHSEGRIERLRIKSTGKIEIRFSWWMDGRMMPKPLDLPEADLMTLLARGIKAGVLMVEE